MNEKLDELIKMLKCLQYNLKKGIAGDDYKKRLRKMTPFKVSYEWDLAKLCSSLIFNISG